MANSKLRMFYFNSKGRAETARIICLIADKEIDDVRYEQNEWPKHRHIAPFGQIPVLEVDGKRYAQSVAIKTFLAREFGLHGRTNLESLAIDQIVQLVEDFTNIVLVALFCSEDQAVVEKAVAKIKANEGVKYLRFFEKLLQENENDTGYFVGNRLTLADIAVFDIITGMCKNAVDLNDNFPLLKKHVQIINNHSKIGPYIASRRITPL